MAAVVAAIPGVAQKGFGVEVSVVSPLVCVTVRDRLDATVAFTATPPICHLRLSTYPHTLKCIPVTNPQKAVKTSFECCSFSPLRLSLDPTQTPH